MSLKEFLGQLDGVRRSGSGWTAMCPGHDDGHASLSVGEGEDGRVLLKCFAGCDAESLVAALGLTLADLMPERREKSVRRRRGKGGVSTPPRNAATVQQSPGCTLAAYAEAKRLPVASLKALGLSDCSYLGSPALRIPYFAVDGHEAAVRFRVGLSGDDRFRWKSGSRTSLYGLNRLDRSRGYVVLVEGESDCHTLWLHNIPALGIPGAANWREDRDAQHLDGIEQIYVVVEPDNGGKTVERRIATSPIRNRVRIIGLRDYKDISGLYLDDPARFEERWKAAMQAAVPLSEKAAAEAIIRREEAWRQCESLARQPRILDQFAMDIALAGLAGETRAAQLFFLAIVSRHLERPVSCAGKGPSSGGKSYTVAQTLRFFPESAYYALTAMSERALAYSDEPLKHRVLVLYEAGGIGNDFASYLVRSLLSEGCVDYETVEKTKDGLRPRRIRREGPTGLIVTTTAVRLHPENETRMLSIPITDTQEQTRSVLLALAMDGEGTDVDLGRWHALAEWIKGGEHHVCIPYAKDLAEKIPAIGVRLRRDFSAVLSLIRAHALLHQADRARDGKGRIVATLDDYEVVRSLVADVISHGVEAGVPANVREAVEAVGALTAAAGAEAMAQQVAARLQLDKSSASRRIKSALARGYLQNLEERKGRPMRLIIGEPMPADVEILPEAGALNGCTVAREKEETRTTPLQPSALTHILPLLKGIRPSGGGYVADCPAHPNKEQKLTFCVGEDGKLIFYCLGGCATDAVRAALGLPPIPLPPGVTADGDGDGGLGPLSAGQRVSTPGGAGEVFLATANRVEVRLDFSPTLDAFQPGDVRPVK